jgi:hypothetical protein
MVMRIHVVDFCVITPCTLVGGYQHFGRTYSVLFRTELKIQKLRIHYYKGPRKQRMGTEWDMWVSVVMMVIYYVKTSQRKYKAL